MWFLFRSTKGCGAGHGPDQPGHEDGWEKPDGPVQVLRPLRLPLRQVACPFHRRFLFSPRPACRCRRRSSCRCNYNVSKREHVIALQSYRRLQNANCFGIYAAWNPSVLLVCWFIAVFFTHKLQMLLMAEYYSTFTMNLLGKCAFIMTLKGCIRF